MKQNKNKMYLGNCCGNSFVILDYRNHKLSRQEKIKFAKENIIKYETDSALFLKKTKKANIYVEIFERDGSESDSCGNGILLISHLLKLKRGEIETKGSIMRIVGDGKRQALLMEAGFSEIKKINDGGKGVFVRCGEPHLVFLVDNLNKIDLVKDGKKNQKRYPKGINVDMIQRLDNSHYLIRTYERGVFAETKSCGTGSLSAYKAISYFNNNEYNNPIEFKSRGGIHWVSRKGGLLKLETLKKFCKFKKI